MKRFLVLALVSGLLSLAGCAAPATPPTPTATLVQPTNTPAPVKPTDLPAPTSTTVPTVIAATPAPGATATKAASSTPASTATEAATATPAATNTPAVVYITYKDFEIVPAQMTIKVGTKVVFLISAGLFISHQPYNFTAPNVFEAPANMGNGVSYTYTFTEPGTVTLLCGYHSEMSMTLIVEP